ncbi:MAG TPA: hypothetical protein VJY33_01940 [Isosphaeraceae bacterium]|nr:hypothetical protein [Isosphaeraceae bacterium]
MGFDPYETWLGIPPDRRPPTHYDLLGLAPYESDPATIDQAALRRMSKVRQYQIGPHSDQSQEILSELARARLILMDPDRRTDYDAKLRARGETRPGPLVAPQKVRNGDALHRPSRHDDAPYVHASLSLTEQAGDGALSLRSVSNKRPSWWKTGLVLAALLGAFFYYVFGPPTLNQKGLDSDRNGPDLSTPTQKPKPSVPPDSKPVVPPKPAPPPIVEPPRADPPGGGGEPETPAVATHLERDKDSVGPAGPGQAKPSGTGADPGGRTTPPNDDAIAEQLRRSKETYEAAQKAATEDLLKAFDKQIDFAKRDRKPGWKARLKDIQDEKLAFKDDHVLPKSSGGMKSAIMRSAINKHEKEMTNARDKRSNEYEKAVGDYLKQGKNARATEVRQEGQAFLQRTAALLAKPIVEGVLLPTAELGPPREWLYTTVKPGPVWTAPQFDTRDWATGIAAFGSEGTPNIRIGTLWNTEAIWLRTSLDVPRLSPDHVIILRLRHDDDVKIYVNGELPIQLPWWNNNYDEIVLTDAQKSLFCERRNTLAVNCTNKGGAQGIDLGLTLFLKK